MEAWPGDCRPPSRPPGFPDGLVEAAPGVLPAGLSRTRTACRRLLSRHHTAFLNPETTRLLLEDDALRLRRLFSSHLVPEVEIERQLGVIGNPQALEAALAWYRCNTTRPQMGKTTVPTLYIWGDADGTIGPKAAYGTREFVDAEFQMEVLAGVGHFVMDQAPDRATELILEQVADHRASQADRSSPTVDSEDCMNIEREIVASRSAWLGQDLQASGEWIYRLGDEEVAEIDAALGHLKASGQQIPHAGRDDFPLKRFARTLRLLRTEIEYGLGFMLIRGLPRDRYSAEDMGLIFWGIGAHLGRAARRTPRATCWGTSATWAVT